MITTLEQRIEYRAVEIETDDLNALRGRITETEKFLADLRREESLLAASSIASIPEIETTMTVEMDGDPLPDLCLIDDYDLRDYNE